MSTVDGGVSGDMEMTTGSTTGGTSDINMTSGKSTGGKGGTITLSVGDGDTGVGGDVNINAGMTSAVCSRWSSYVIR